MNADDFRTLYAYNLWANHLILDKAAEVSEGDYAAVADGISFGSLRGTLLHLIDTEAGWLARWQGIPEPETLIEASLPDFTSLRAHWSLVEEQQAAFLATLEDAAISAPLTFSFRSGREVKAPFWQLLLHLVNHSTQFRSEAAVRLTQLGKSPGNLDFFIYLRQLSQA